MKANKLIKDLLAVESDVDYLRTIFDEITYSPEDNKLRLYPNFRFDKELWLYFKSIGLKYASKQELFVFSHRISREDLCLFLLPEGDEIQPEGTTLAERAEIKAERLAGYYENRVRDMNAYSRAASSYSERFAQGQPILRGHHSERSARTAKKRAESATRNSLDHQRRANYWSWKIGGVAHYANMKADNRVRVGRIEKLLKELRDSQKTIASHKRRFNNLCNVIDLQNDESYKVLAHKYISYHNYDAMRDIENGLKETDLVMEQLTTHFKLLTTNDYYPRMIKHILNRLSYENSLLPETTKFSPSELTNAILKKFLVKHGCPSAPKEIKLKLDKKQDQITVTLINDDLPLHLGQGKELTCSRSEWCETMHDLGYEVPAAKPKPPALLNINAEGFIKLKQKYTGFRGEEFFKVCEFRHLTKDEYKTVYHESRGTFYTEDGKYRIRVCLDPKADGPYYSRPWVAVYLTDAKAHPMPVGLEINKKLEGAA